jgi:hypothetical protein
VNEAEEDDLSERGDVLRTAAGLSGGPVLVCAWDKFSCGTATERKSARRVQSLFGTRPRPGLCRG